MSVQQDGSIVYSIPVSEKKDGETAIYRGPLFKDGLTASFKPEWNSLQDAFLESVKLNGERPFISQRNPQNENKYETFTYNQIFSQAKQLASGMFKLGLINEAEEWRGAKPKVVGIQSKNRKEWTLVDIGLSWLHGVSLVCLYDTLGADTISYILNHSKPTSTFCDLTSANSLLKTKDLGNLKTVILFDAVTEEQTKLAAERGVKLLTLQEVIDQGTEEIALPKLDRKTIMTFSYTSGTTGVPKGAMVTHENFLSMHGVFKTNESSLSVTNDDVYLSYLPLPHIFDRIIVVTFSLAGAQIYFYGGDVMKLGQDILDARPTVLASVPRLWNRFHDKIKASFAQKSPQEQAGIELAIKEKLENLRTKAVYKHEKWDPLIFDKINQGVFGGRLRYAVTGAAPISREVIDFLKICIQAPLLEGYGQTESTGASFTTSFFDPQSGHVGGPSSATEVKLVDVPDMNYLSTDKDENGNPEPRGEICFKGPGVFFGYYKDDEKTNEAVDSDGWLHSGDIGKIRSNGSWQVIDRKKNIFKLAQGEYIAPEKIEGVYKCVKGVGEIYVHGESLQATLVGIVVPDPEILPIIAKQLGIEETNPQLLCQNPKLVEHFLNILTEEGKRQKLLGFEQIKGLYLEPTPFILKGILTSTMKLQRHLAKKVFEKQIQEFYSKQQ